MTQGSYGFVAKLQNDLYSCTGALIDPLWVITARACMAENGQPVNGVPARITTATVGRTDLAGTAGHVLDVVEVVSHPARDVALVRLSSPVTDVTPIAIGSVPPQVDDALRIAGYGRTATEWAPDVLQAADFAVRSVTDTSVTVIGDGPATPSTCKGDAGGPAFRETDGRAELVAVASTSWQAGCLAETETRQGGSAVRVDTIAEWIRQGTGSCWTQAEAGSVPLYDGRSSQSQAWRSAGTVTVAEYACEMTPTGTGVRWYAGSHTTGSYTLRLDWKALSRDADSGVFVGFPMPDDDPAVPGARGLEVQIKPAGTAGDATGAVVGVRIPDVTTAARPVGQWNSYEIAVDGKRVTVRLNGVVVNDVTLDDPDRLVRSAFIGVQAGAAAAPVRFRNIRITMGPRDPLFGQFADFDGDGRPDIAGFGMNGDLWVHPNASTPGNLAKAGGRLVTLGWGTVHQTAAVDFDGDGTADVLGLSGNTLLLWLGPTFPGGGSVNFGTGWQVFDRWLPPADFDGDGRPDIAGVAGNDLWIHRNTSTPGHPSEGGGRYVSTGWSSLTNFITADVDADGRTDIVSVAGNSVWIWRSTSTDAAFSFEPLVAVDLGRTPRHVSVIDFDGDGRADIVAHAGGDLWVYRNTGAPGTISMAAGQFENSGWGTVTNFMTTDFDGDGKADVLGLNGTSLLAWRSTATASQVSVAPFVNFGAGWDAFSRFLTVTPSG